ncbi:MAG: response regulator [candidate division Zixibacteria bacterium]
MEKRILIVDDNPNMASLLSEMLEVFDYKSVQAGDGKEALSKLGKHAFAMVITDLRMPNMNGLELLKNIKGKHPKMPVVIISGYSASEFESDPDCPKPDGFLSKPFLMTDIELLLEKLL